MLLPLQTTFSLLQTRWKSILDPILSNPTTNMSILKNISLTVGENQIAHKLGQNQQGWVILDVDAPTAIYRSHSFNNAYLYLTSSAAATVTLGVF